MDSAELARLLTPEALRLLDEVDGSRPVDEVNRLRRAGHRPDLVAAVVSQAALRVRARAKFGPFADRMLFTPAGLEQATRLRVAALHAGRFRDAGLGRVADLGCGIGSDALALSAIDVAVRAVDRDEVAAAVAAYNLSDFPDTTVEVGTAETTPLDDVDAVYLDPARRTGGQAASRRLHDPADWSPSLDFAFALAERMPVGVKLGPGLDRDLIPDSAEAQWVSVDGQLVEMGLWFGPLAREGIRRSALVLTGAGAAELTGPADSPDVGDRPLGGFLYEPDGAVIRARLIGALAERLEAGMVSPSIAYLTSDQLIETPFASAFRILERLPASEQTLKKALRERGIGTLEIKKRGIDVDPASLRKRLGLRGERSATVVLTRVAGRHEALLVERPAPADADR